MYQIIYCDGKDENTHLGLQCSVLSSYVGSVEFVPLILPQQIKVNLQVSKFFFGSEEMILDLRVNLHSLNPT